MTATQRYRAQHAELFALVTRITPLLDDANLGKKAAEIRSLISSLAGKLSIHLAMEGKRLYPKRIATPTFARWQHIIRKKWALSPTTLRNLINAG